MIHRQGLMGAAAVLVVLAGAVWSVESWATKDTGGTAYRETRQVRHLSARPPSGEAKRDMEERIAVYLGISRDEVEALIDQGVKRCDLVPAAAIAKLSDRDLRAVLDAKTEQKTWHTVAKDLGVDTGKFRREMQRILPEAAKKSDLAGPPSGGGLQEHCRVFEDGREEAVGDDQKGKSSSAGMAESGRSVQSQR
ncbi:MAG: hypothetical protein LOD87_10610 [Planifilum fulgidum]